MTKYELAGYLSALISIMENKDDAGLPKGVTLTDEYNFAYGDLVRALREEHKERETRSKPLVDGRNESRAESPSDLARRNSEDRNSAAYGQDNPGSGPRRDVAES